MSQKVIFALVLAMAVAVFAAPAEESQESGALSAAVPAVMAESAPSPTPRVTCPLFPWACNQHCKAKGFKAGTCLNGVCVCRR